MTTPNSKICRNPGCKYNACCQFVPRGSPGLDNTMMLRLIIDNDGIAIFSVADDVDSLLVKEAKVLQDRLGEYKAVLVYINSGGGYSGPAESVIGILKEIGTRVPVVACIKNALSAGLSIALACQEVYIVKDGRAGGLGSHSFICYQGKQPVSTVSALSTEKSIDIESGPNFYDLQPHSEKIQNEIQQICDDALGRTFVSILESRETSIEQLGPLATGSSIGAEEMVMAGLVDAVVGPGEVRRKVGDMIKNQHKRKTTTQGETDEKSVRKII